MQPLVSYPEAARYPPLPFTFVGGSAKAAPVSPDTHMVTARMRWAFRVSIEVISFSLVMAVAG